MNKHLVEIVEKTQLNSDTYQFTIHAPELSDSALPGQFLHINCSSDVAMLRRPISIFDIDKAKYTVSFVFQVRGHGTELLAKKNVGDKLDILAPLGNGFAVNSTFKSVCIAGGGIGIFPLFALLKQYPDAHKTSIVGFTSVGKFVINDEFAAISDKFIYCTDDGSGGFHGNTAQALELQLQAGDLPDIIYACGPTMMLNAIAKLSMQFNIPCQVSLEERMACGIGACLVCACKTKADSQSGWQHSHVCKDGPVFWAQDVVWEN
ncbi:MAG: dihydroorotate dehydrogenase electron transfer subunit [Negativicutes bacterium]|jgi:dihydroorotate dehydrogenase electron transfer subunit